MTEKDKSEEKLKPSHGSKEIESHGGNSTVRNDASTQESPAGVQSVETEDPIPEGRQSSAATRTAETECATGRWP